MNAPESSTTPPAAVAAPPVSILLVDDEVRNLEVLESFLQSPDYQLVRAGTAEQALLLLLQGDFAAIVLDIHLPTMSGLELANLIKQRKRTQHIPIIFLTAYFQEDKDVLEGYGSGAVDYLTKPVNPQILKSKIAVFVDLFRKTRALAATNAALEQEIAQRLAAEEALRLANNALEARVQERTADLSRLNAELRERETAVRESEAQALAASRAKDHLLATLSHELRTPLSPVLLLATEATHNPRLPPEVRADFDIIARNVALEARLIDDLLDFTGIERGKLALKMRAFHAHDMLMETLTMIRPELDLKDLRLSLLLGAGEDSIYGDDVRLKQVFWNILQNAVKFTPPGGTVRVITATLPDTAELAIKVTDSGLGMTAEELERIFAPFAQGDHAVQHGAHRYGGLGLGLAISRTMVELHAGSISAASAGRNQGTAFLIKLPLLRTAAETEHQPDVPPEAEPPMPEPAADSGGRPRRVLVVEDHKATARVLAQLLSIRQYEVVIAGNLSEASRLGRHEEFDVLISDIGLPDGTGYELMKELREHQPGLVGIALTGYGMDDDVSRSQEAGFVAHLTKPISMQALDTALAAASRQVEPALRAGSDLHGVQVPPATYLRPTPETD